MRKALVFVFAILALTGFSQGSVDERIKAHFNENKKLKTFLINVKQSDSKQYYHFVKETKQLIAYQKYDKVNGVITKYFFKDGQLIFMIYHPNKDFDKQIKGGLYYFVDGKLQEKEEYNIEAKDPQQLLAEANTIFEEAQTLLKAKG